ncbi:MAG: heme handling protein Hhp [Algoriphagus marincola HL-49]|uniref:Heme handling protein Hhp n=1 Tax=Algoriphagus marincola HL-49 TaxID=1305737 RepID=A0A0P7X365_9BACT|nr:MAG: heme handling protein Hhp [Algoriphagus marincola HL-49]
MKDQILSHLDQAEELEKLYRKNKSEFKKAFLDIYPSIQNQSPISEFWKARLQTPSDSIQWGEKSDWTFLILVSLLAGLYAKLPTIFPIQEDFFYPKNLGLMVFPFVSAYFAWKNKLSQKSTIILTLSFLASLLYINLLPDNESSDTLVLACIHLPILLWGLLGFSFGGENWKSFESRLGFLRFNGDAIIMGGLLVLSGGILSAITIGLFSLIGLRIEEFYMEYIAVFGLASIPLIATHLTQTNPQLVNKVPPIIARIFSPLVLVMLLVYLGAIVYAGKDPYNDREFLLLFNLLLIGVMALIFFSIAENSQGKIQVSQNWLLLLLALATLLVNAVALSAIIFRINEWGFTPNRTAILGINILMMVHLIWVGKNLLLTVRSKKSTEQVGQTISNFLPAYLVWAGLVAFLFPIVFGNN